MKPKFKVLCISGGGIRGIYAASFLARIEAISGKKFVDHFDLIVGTSTGGLIAIAIGLDQPLAEVRDFYRSDGARLFPNRPIRRWMRALRHFGWAKHDANKLREAIQRHLGQNRLFGHAIRPLVVTSFHVADGKPICFKTRHHPDFKNDHKLPAWQVAMATAAAPTYYRAYQFENGAEFIDGGIWASCPVLVGAIEAIDRFGKDRSEIEVLSVGTTRTPFFLDPKTRKGGARHYLSMFDPPIVHLLSEAHRSSSMYMAKRLLGNGAVVEIDHVLKSGKYKLDNASATCLRDLQALGEEAAKANVREIEARFLNDIVPPWAPCP